MFLQQICVAFVVVCCALQLAGADPDCKNLKERADEIEQCCQLDPIIPLKEADDCSSAADDVSDPHEKMMCPLQCKLQSLGLMNGKEMVPEKALEYANRLDGEWKEKATEAVKMCNQRISAAKEEIGERTEHLKCSPVGGFFMMCLMKQTFDSCPAEKWQNTDFCNKIKSGECSKRRDRQ